MIYKIAVVKNTYETLTPKSKLLKFQEIFFLNAYDGNSVVDMLRELNKGTYIILDKRADLKDFPDGELFTVMDIDDPDIPF